MADPPPPSRALEDGYFQRSGLLLRLLFRAGAEMFFLMGERPLVNEDPESNLGSFASGAKSGAEYAMLVPSRGGPNAPPISRSSSVCCSFGLGGGLEFEGPDESGCESAGLPFFKLSDD